ncbi:MAG: RDD family protein [Verrucomicrobiae bacterium]|nr:RDD family protein [Verrucomicrobiae bacterium]
MMLGKTTTLSIRTPEGVHFEIPIASPFSRCLALAVDVAIVIALTILLIQVINLFGVMFSEVPVLGKVFSDFSTGAMIVLQFTVSIGYGMSTEWLWSGRTLGKRIMRLRVIDERGLSLSLKQVIIRNLFRFLDMLPSTFYLLGGISCALTKRCQRLGDIAAGTLVVREVDSTPPVLEEFVRAEKNSFATLPHLEARLRQRTSPEEARLVLDAVTRRNDLTPSARLELFSRLADHFRSIAEFPEEITIGLSDEQYVRNVAATLFHRASV